MPIYDAIKRKIVVRVVYDGPGHAGKTTNVRELARVFNAGRRTEVVTPEEIDGRTQYFDYVQIEGGLVLGHALSCQALSVPGQRELERRRNFLLDSADAVVFVCAATDEGLAEAAPMYRELLARLETCPSERRPSVVLQLNKQDLAREDVEARAMHTLGVGAGTRIVFAQADRGIGVRDTIALAMRAAAERAQVDILARGVDDLVGQVDDANALLLAMQRVSEAPPPMPNAFQRVPNADAVEPPPPHALARLVWPSDRGQEILRRFWAAGPPRRMATAATSSQPTAWTVSYESGLWTSVASSERAFDTETEAVAALAELGHERLMLGALLPRNTALVASSSGPRFVVHTIRPGYATIGQQLAHAARAENTRGVEEALMAYGSAIIEAISIAIERHLVLVVHPDAFATVGPALYYVEDRLTRGSTLEGVARAILEPMAAVESFGVGIERQVLALENALEARFAQSELKAVGLVDSLRTYEPRTPFTLIARARLIAAAMGRRSIPASC